MHCLDGWGTLDFPPFTTERREQAALVARLLRGGQAVRDGTFDAIYPRAVGRASVIHWTPVRIGARVVELLGLRPGERLLDIGAGAGKLCIVAAAMSGATVRGIERHPGLVTVACEAARRFGVDVDFGVGSFESEDPTDYQALYLFNPFNDTVDVPGLDHERFRGRAAFDIRAAERFLQNARAGARLVTLCGFGGTVPDDWVLVYEQAWVGGVLALWEKTDEPARRRTDSDG